MPDQAVPMLRPEEFTVGTIGETIGLSLVLPRTQYEATLLVAGAEGQRVAIIIAGNDAFTSFPAGDNGSYAGLVIPDVRIEVDPRSARDTQYAPLRPGMAVRSGGTLSIATTPAGGMRFRPLLTPVVWSGLPELPGDKNVGFLSWRIALGDGVDSRMLLQFSIPEPADISR